MRICFLVDRPLGDPEAPVMTAAARILAQRGYKLSSVLFTDILQNIATIRVSADLYLSKASSELQISLAGILHDRGARLLNTWESSSYVRDKARVTAAMIAAGLPVPDTYIATDIMPAADALDGLPVIVKPVRGTSGRGIEIVRAPGECERLGRGPHFVQRYDRVSGDDLKAYVIGDHVSIVRRPFPAVTFADKLGELVHDPDLEALALATGRLFNLEIYGVDIVQTSRGPVVVDVNACPGFVGAENAGPHLADYIDATMRGETPAGRVAVVKQAAE